MGYRMMLIWLAIVAAAYLVGRWHGRRGSKFDISDAQLRRLLAETSSCATAQDCRVALGLIDPRSSDTAARARYRCAIEHAVMAGPARVA